MMEGYTSYRDYFNEELEKDPELKKMYEQHKLEKQIKKIILEALENNRMIEEEEKLDKTVETLAVFFAETGIKKLDFELA